MQRLGAACWSGDIDNTFAAFAAQVPRGLNTALSGVPYWGTDIGGFFHPVEESGELFVRWFQFGAFCPIFRAHGYLWREHVPWAHGREIEEICRRFVELRYELLPYTYTLAHEAAEKGLPLMRPLCLNYPLDSNVADLGDEYLWGDDLLVAPVTKAGARHWSLYLPEGAWFDFWTNRRYEGMQGVEVEAPLQHMPLLVREGAILPMSRPMQYTEEHPLEEVTLLIYPAGHSSFELYEDDGRTNGYARGSAARTHIRSRRGPAGVEVEIEASAGDSSHIPPHRTYLIRILSNRPSKVVDGEGRFLRELRGAGEGGAGWWHEESFTHVRTERKSGTFRVIPP